MVQNVRYLNGPPSHATLPFEYWTLILSGIQVFGIQMVTVLLLKCLNVMIWRYLERDFIESICFEVVYQMTNKIIWHQHQGNLIQREGSDSLK